MSTFSSILHTRIQEDITKTNPSKEINSAFGRLLAIIKKVRQCYDKAFLEYSDVPDKYSPDFISVFADTNSRNHSAKRQTKELGKGARNAKSPEEIEKWVSFMKEDIKYWNEVLDEMKAYIKKHPYPTKSEIKAEKARVEKFYRDVERKKYEADPVGYLNKRKKRRDTLRVARSLKVVGNSHVTR